MIKRCPYCRKAISFKKVLLIANLPISRNWGNKLSINCDDCKKVVTKPHIPAKLFIGSHLVFSLFIAHLLVHHLLPEYSINLNKWFFLLIFLVISNLTLYFGLPIKKQENDDQRPIQ